MGKELNIGRYKINSILTSGEIYNNSYYIKLTDCPQELVDKYDKPINKMLPKYSKRIKQTNIFSNKIRIFNSLAEVYSETGAASVTSDKEQKKI
jgi:hypothetical protein